MKRGSGILLHISSLPSPYGIGTLGRAAYDFVDDLCAAQQSYWQVLPCTPTGYADSPYQGTSAFAYNPYFIDFDLLKDDGLLKKSDYEHINFGTDDACVDYDALFSLKSAVLEKAYKNGIKKYSSEFEVFKFENAVWLFDYALFVVLKKHFEYLPYQQWDKCVIDREPAAIMELTQRYEKEIECVQFTQFLYERQWFALKEYANANGIQMIGDIPIYVSPDSAETWSHPEYFVKDGSVAGTPPDYFCDDGQLWGNPLYDWDYMREHGYEWWVRRMKRSLWLYNIVRIDHFRGFEAYFKIPRGGTPKDGEWVKGPAGELFDAIKTELPMPPIIAEDLGVIDDNVKGFLEYCGFPGLKVLQFAFDEQNSCYLPHNYTRNSVVYTGTHDNDIMRHWFENAEEQTKQYLFSYIGVCTASDVASRLIQLAMMSVADISIIPMQDLLNLSGEARMNYPSHTLGNWKWRMKKDAFTDERIEWLRTETQVYGR
ncbi:MAG: 4-alpha-glucanotransferase [Christensenella sp.]